MVVTMVCLAFIIGIHLFLGILFLSDGTNPINGISSMYRDIIEGIKEPFELRAYKKELRVLNKELQMFERIESLEREKECIKNQIDEYKQKYS